MPRAKKFYPEPYIRNQKGVQPYYYFEFRDPETGQRSKIATGIPKGKKEDARQFIRNYVDKYNNAEQEKERNPYDRGDKNTLPGTSGSLEI